MKKQRGEDVRIPNGPVTTAAKLAMSLHYFAGGDPYDIAPLFGTS